MGKIEDKECYKAVDALLSGDSAAKAAPEFIAHAVTCSECQDYLNSISDLRTYQSAFEEQTFPELKQRIIGKLEQRLSERFNKNKVIAKQIQSSQNIKTSWFKFAFAFASVSALFIYIVSSYAAKSPTNVIEKTIQTAKNINSNDYQYKVVINGCIEKEINDLQATLAIFKDETAEISYSDGSYCKLAGPAKINLSPRGFDLTSGDLMIDVAKDDAAPFIGITPHGKITFSETSLTVTASPQITEVCVISGKAKLSMPQGKERYLISGESAVMLPQRG